MAAIVLMMVFAVGCTKPEEPNNGGNNNNQNDTIVDPNNGGGNNGNNDNDVRVTTYAPQDITATTAKCGGDAIVVQGLSLSGLGVCWSSESNPTVEDAHLTTSNWNDPYVCTITGLEPSSCYHIRAFAIRGLVYYYGEDVSFTTEGGELPTVSTMEVTNVTAYSAKGSGSVTSDGGVPITERGVCWSTVPNPNVDGAHANVGVGFGNGLGIFAVDMDSLAQNTTYYVRAYAKNYYGVSYGEQVSFSTLIGELPMVTTMEATDIALNSAKCGGTVVSEGSLPVTNRGICWSTTPSPTIDDAHESMNSGMGAFTVFMLGLERNTTYYVRAYAENYYGVSYGEQKSFATLNPPIGVTYNGHEYVDLGLPSGTLWATCNVGATTPDGYGDYFAWGEAEPKAVYSWNTYKYNVGEFIGNNYQLTKYCNNPNVGYNGYVDNLLELEPVDDAATANWGNGWCMPTWGQWFELSRYTTNFWANQNGVNGWFFVAANGNVLFLPAAGIRVEDYGGDDDCYGYYWSKSLYGNHCYTAMLFPFTSTSNNMDNYLGRPWGCSVRPVRSAK